MNLCTWNVWSVWTALRLERKTQNLHGVTVQNASLLLCLYSEYHGMLIFRSLWGL